MADDKAQNRSSSTQQEQSKKDGEDFSKVWDIGVYDAHCHPTDIMDSISRIPDMKARVLTVMSTRAQDQELVADIAVKHGIRGKEDLSSSDRGSERAGQQGKARRVIPAFGWHPWFSHLIWDDRSVEGPDTTKSGANKDEENTTAQTDRFDVSQHFRRVLNPEPDETFIKTLQSPIPLTRFLFETETRLHAHPLALIGEIGLDRSFRIPEGPSSMTGDVSMKTGGDEGTYTPGSREGRRLTPYKVNLDQQRMVLKAQLELAAKNNRAVSVHSVQAHGMVFEVLQDLWKGHQRPSKRMLRKQRDDPDTIANVDDEEEQSSVPQTQTQTQAQNQGQDNGTLSVKSTSHPPYPPRVCMHSFSGPAQMMRMFVDPRIPSDMFLSFSECINFGSPASKKAVEVIGGVPDDKILVESDLHCAGEAMDGLLEDIVRKVCEIKGWGLEEGARILRRNWERFVFGD